MSPTERIILGHKAWRLAARLLRERCQKLQAEARLACTHCGGPIEGVRYCSEECWEADGAPMEVASDFDLKEFSVSHEGHEYHAQAMYRGEEMSQRMARVFAEALEEQAAPNYLELRMLYAPEGRPAVPLVVTVQRVNGQTAHELRAAAEFEVKRLQAALDSANARCNRIQADGNALADQLHAWRQACIDHGIAATPEGLRAALRRVDAACVTGADL